MDQCNGLKMDIRSDIKPRWTGQWKGNRCARRKPTQAPGEHANVTQVGRSRNLTLHLWGERAKTVHTMPPQHLINKIKQKGTERASSLWHEGIKQHLNQRFYPRRHELDHFNQRRICNCSCHAIHGKTLASCKTTTVYFIWLAALRLVGHSHCVTCGHDFLTRTCF